MKTWHLRGGMVGVLVGVGFVLSEALPSTSEAALRERFHVAAEESLAPCSPDLFRALDPSGKVVQAPVFCGVRHVSSTWGNGGDCHVGEPIRWHMQRRVLSPRGFAMLRSEDQGKEKTISVSIETESEQRSVSAVVEPGNHTERADKLRALVSDELK